MKYLITALCSLLLSTAALAQPATLLGPDLEPTTVTLKSWSPEGVVILGPGGKEQRLNSDEVLRLTLSDEPTRVAEDLAIVRLTDGQVLVGTWHGMGQSDDEIGLSLQGDVVRSISLDDILNFSHVKEVPWPGEEADADTLTLTNGEVLSGFIDAVEQKEIQFVLDGTDDPIAVPFEHVHAFSVANPPEPTQPEAGRSRVTFYNGTALLVDDSHLQWADGRWSLIGGTTGVPGPAIDTARLGSVTRIEPLSIRYALAPLGQQPMQTRGGGEVFGVPMPPRPTPDGALKLHAPVTLDFDLPDGASRVAFSIGLALGGEVSPSRRALAGCELVVYDGEEVIQRAELLPDEPSKRINLPLNSSDLRIELKPGVNGPVLDRVLLSDAEVLITTR